MPDMPCLSPLSLTQHSCIRAVSALQQCFMVRCAGLLCAQLQTLWWQNLAVAPCEFCSTQWFRGLGLGVLVCSSILLVSGFAVLWHCDSLTFRRQASALCCQHYQSHVYYTEHITITCLYVVLYRTVLYRTVLYCTIPCCTVLYCIVLYCTVLYCTVLYCTVLYFTTYASLHVCIL